jgi:hypothetical protein
MSDIDDIDAADAVETRRECADAFGKTVRAGSLGVVLVLDDIAGMPLAMQMAVVRLEDGREIETFVSNLRVVG